MNKQRRRLLISLALSVAVAGLLLFAAGFGLLTTWQAQSTDFLFKARAGESSSKVAIVAIDDRSLRELAGDGRVFNWRRSHYAKVIGAVAQAGARVIVLDVLFDAPTAEDDALAGAIAVAGNVVLPLAGDLPTVQTRDAPINYDLLTTPVPALARAAAAVGHINVQPDGDGTVRRVQLTIASKGQEIPAASLAAAARYLRRPSALEGPPKGGAVPFAGRDIPIADSSRGMYVNYLGAPLQAERPSAFTVVSFSDVLQGKADLAPLRDKVVLIGLVATGFADDYWTPSSVGRKMSGVEVHANAVETILRPAFLRPISPAAANLIVLVMAVLAGAATLGFRALPAAGIAVGMMIAFILAASAMFDRGVLASLVYPLLAPPLSFAVTMIYRVRFIETDQRAARRLLSGYLSPSVMREVLKDPERLRLGGEKRVLTVLFSDIREFTTYSEQVEPAELARLLNEYLTEMSAVVFEQEGVVDKYMGDGLMAFWGAPVAQEDQARRACLAALEMLRRLEVLSARWRNAGIPPFRIGIGIHTGLMAVGNMGSMQRFSYTVIGDAVNLTSRLEGLTKVYGTNIIISEATLQQVGNALEQRFLDVVAVKGKREPVAVYELMPPLDAEGSQATDRRQELLREYAEGIRLSRQRSWHEAISAFQRALEACPGDGPASFHLERSKEQAGDPPADDWGGVYIAKAK